MNQSQKPTNMISNLFRRTMEPATDAGFSFIELMGAKMGAKNMKHVKYRPARISRGKKWYISYQFLVDGVWKRFKVYENINRIHDKYEKEEYAQELAEAVNRALKEGFDPVQLAKQYATPKQQEKVWTIQQAILLFKQKLEEKGIEKSSVGIYKGTIKSFLKWAEDTGIWFDDINTVTETYIENYLDHKRVKSSWSNRHYNNELNRLKTIFIFLQKKGMIKVNPCALISRKKIITTKHRYYDEKTLKRVMDKLKKDDPYLYFACQVVYYLCIRSEKELKRFRVGNIFPERKQVLINGPDSKVGADRFIPMPDEMLKVFKSRGILDYPPEYYVFSSPHKNKFIKDGEPGPEPFGKGFFSKRFSYIRKDLGLDRSFTIYGFKHTRIIHLKLDGVADGDMMALTGHSDYVSFGHYLRDLGLTVNPDSINQKTRKL